MPSMLIVDDDLHLRKLVLTYAQMEQFQCREAETGAQALDILRETPFDIIILDVMMPGMDGFEALAEIRKFSQAPVILLTAGAKNMINCWALNLGADDYVPKPISPKELMARVGAVLRRTGRPKAVSWSLGGFESNRMPERCGSTENRLICRPKNLTCC